MLFKRILPAFLAALFLSAPLAKANEIVAVDQANPPFMYEIGGQLHGIYPALIRETFHRMGEEVQLSALPWRRALNEANAGTCGVAGVYKNSERLSNFDFSDKLFDEVIEVYVAKGNSFALHGVRGLHGRVVGVLRGWSYGDEFDMAVKAGKIKVEEVSGDMQNFEKLAAGRLDAVLANRESADIVISSGGLNDKVETLTQPLISTSTYLAFAKSANKAEVLARFNAALAAMHGDGSFDRIVAAISSSP